MRIFLHILTLSLSKGEVATDMRYLILRGGAAGGSRLRRSWRAHRSLRAWPGRGPSGLRDLKLAAARFGCAHALQGAVYFRLHPGDALSHLAERIVGLEI